ncbi:MAG: pitrilysin family protein [Melioribacteraceae bacterium]|nr:pitrilysin family protein [Melioribacteraceae bacterium]
MKKNMNRSSAPEPTKKISFDIPQIKVLNLNNGLEVYYVKKEKLPIVQSVIISSTGSIGDPDDKKGLAFLTSLLIDEGAGGYDALQLNNELEKLGTITSISANHDTFSFSILSLKENFERSFELLSKIILEPRFEEKDFAREKKKMLDKILQLKDEPSFIASSAFEKRLFKDAPYGSPEIGFEQTASRISNGDVKSFYRKNFRGSNFKSIVVGNITEEEIVRLFNKYLNTLKSKYGENDPIILPAQEKTKIYFVDKKDSAQSEIRIGHITKKRDAEDFYAARLMNTILGGQFSSRINLNLREKRGLTYGAGSSINYFKNAGYLEVSTAVNINNTGEAVSEIVNELNLIREKIFDEEIEFAKSYLIKQFPSKFETYTQIAKNISPLIVHNLPIDYYYSYEKSIELVTTDEIGKAALEYIKPDETTIVVVGDKTEVIPQLRSLSSSEPIELDIYGNII